MIDAIHRPLLQNALNVCIGVSLECAKSSDDLISRFYVTTCSSIAKISDLLQQTGDARWIDNAELNNILDKCKNLSTIFSLSSKSRDTSGTTTNNSVSSNDSVSRSNSVPSNNSINNIVIDSNQIPENAHNTVSNVKIENISNNSSRYTLFDITSKNYSNNNNNQSQNNAQNDGSMNKQMKFKLPTIQFDGDKKKCPICKKTFSTVQIMNSHYNQCRKVILEKYGRLEPWWTEYTCNVSGCKSQNMFYVDKILHGCKFAKRQDYMPDGVAVDCPQCTYNVGDPTMTDWIGTSCISKLKTGSFRGKPRAMCAKFNAKPPKLCCKWYSFIDETSGKADLTLNIKKKQEVNKNKKNSTKTIK